MGKYTLTAVSPKTEEWSFQGNKGEVNMTSFYVKTAETGDKVLKLNRSSKKDAPTTGETLFGKEDTDKKGTPMLKEEKNRSSGGRKYGKSKEEQEAIQKQVALKAAVHYAEVTVGNKELGVDEVLSTADRFNDWLQGKQETVANPFDDNKPVDLSDIPY